MQIGGFQKTSLIDYPDHISSIIWTPKCNFRCPFCYNKDLVFNELPLIKEEEVIGHLIKRQGIIDAIVITGGEPTLQKGLIRFIKKVKNLDYLVKLDTNGTNPIVLKELLKNRLLDYVAMDIKAPRQKYKKLAGVSTSISKIEESVEIIKNLAPDYEFRTTMAPELLNEKDILQITKWLNNSKRYVLQQFQSEGDLIDKNLKKDKKFSESKLKKIKKNIKDKFDEVKIRS
jgi:pyruvate formate lyase activating enzyme